MLFEFLKSKMLMQNIFKKKQEMKTLITTLMVIGGICFPLFLIGAIIFRKEDKQYRINKKMPSKKTIIFIIGTDIALGFLFAGIHTLYGKGVTQYEMWANWFLNLIILTGFIPVGTVVAMLFYFLMLFLINGFINITRKAYDKAAERKRKDDDNW